MSAENVHLKCKKLISLSGSRSGCLGCTEFESRCTRDFWCLHSAFISGFKIQDSWEEWVKFWVAGGWWVQNFHTSILAFHYIFIAQSFYCYWGQVPYGSPGFFWFFLPLQFSMLPDTLASTGLALPIRSRSDTGRQWKSRILTGTSSVGRPANIY